MLRAADGGSRRWWVAGGAALGLSVFVHPTAPLYALTAFAAALVFAPRPPRAVAREAWPGAVALLLAFVPYYVKTLHVLGDRYGVGVGAGRARTFSGRPVWEDALHFVAPGRHDLNYFTVLAAGRGGRAGRRAPATACCAFCAITVAAPVLFFSFVPANGDSALFFDRYMIPVTPAFLTVVVSGCARDRRSGGQAESSRARRCSSPGCWRSSFATTSHHRDAVHRIHVDQVVHAVVEGAGRLGAVRLDRDAAASCSRRSTTATRRTSSTTSSRCGCVKLDLVDDDSCERAQPFLQGAVPRRGVWLFYAAGGPEVAGGEHAFAGAAGVTCSRCNGTTSSCGRGRRCRRAR